ncbi:MAG: ABC transporter permease [Halobaculum sp.]
MPTDPTDTDPDDPGTDRDRPDGAEIEGGRVEETGRDGVRPDARRDGGSVGEATAVPSGVGVVRRVALRFPILLLARRNLARARLRTALAVAAVVVGVVAIGGVGMGGDAFTRSQTAAFSGFGGTAEVFPTEEATFTDSQLRRIEQVAAGARVIPVTSRRAIVESRTESRPLQYTRIGEPSVFYAGEVRSGSIPDNWGTSQSAILGASVAEDLGVTAGDRVRIQFTNGETDRVVVTAVLEPQGFFDPLQADRRVFLTPETDQEYSRVILQATDESASIDRIVADVKSTFNGRERTVGVFQNQATFDSIRTVLSAASAFVTGVGGVSLLVAVVTIANTMLMAVIEREGEIGLLRAVGYSKFAVLRLLLAESAMIGVVGVAVGVPLAVLMGGVANWALLGDPLAFTLVGGAYVAAGSVAGVLASVLAGVYPAWQAANKRPVEAIE